MAALTVKQLRKVYASGKQALKGIDLTVAEGDFFALLGQNGAGKSTTIGIISSLVKKTSGSISVFGYDMDSHFQEAKSLIGVVPQELNFSLFDKTLQILIHQAGYYGIPAKVAAERGEVYLKEMGLWEMHNQPALRLSGGMKRRLMIARALMNHPKLLILDEPTAGVDIELRHTLWRFLKNLNEQGTTIILTTHYLEEAEQLCKNVAIIDHGEIIENANIKMLVNQLKMQTIVLDIDDLPNHVFQLSGYEYRVIDDTSIEVDIYREQSINDLFHALTQQNLKVTSMRNKTNRLEELFINLINENKK